MRLKRSDRYTDRLVRWVRVDMGYGLAECKVSAKVVSERKVSKLFEDGQSTDLLVEIPGGERVWVSFWEEISEPNDRTGYR